MIEVRLAKLLKARGRSLYWLAKETGMSYPAIASVSKGKTERISFTTLSEICRVLECEAGDVLVYVSDAKVSSK
jgi:putative transcriptional regulator